MKIESSVSMAAPGFKEWVRGDCRYRCGACPPNRDVTFDDSFDLFRHVKCQHGLGTAEFIVKYPGYCVRKSNHLCRYVLTYIHVFNKVGRVFRCLIRCYK